MRYNFNTCCCSGCPLTALHYIPGGPSLSGEYVARCLWRSNSRLLFCAPSILLLSLASVFVFWSFALQFVLKLVWLAPSGRPVLYPQPDVSTNSCLFVLALPSLLRIRNLRASSFFPENLTTVRKTFLDGSCWMSQALSFVTFVFCLF